MGRDRLTVKPSAQLTLVRTQHLPPPAETAPDQRRARPGPGPVRAVVCPAVSGSDRAAAAGPGNRGEVPGPTEASPSEGVTCPTFWSGRLGPGVRTPGIPIGRVSAGTARPAGSPDGHRDLPCDRRCGAGPWDQRDEPGELGTGLPEEARGRRAAAAAVLRAPLRELEREVRELRMSPFSFKAAVCFAAEHR